MTEFPAVRLACICLVASGSACAAPSRNVGEYYSRDRSTMMILSEGVGYIGNNPAAPKMPDRKIADLRLLAPLEKVSNGKTVCVAYEHITFVSPSSLEKGVPTDCNGVQFVIESCDDEPSCKRMNILATCHSFSEGKCQTGPGSTPPAFRYRYVYDTKQGIISVDFAPDARNSNPLLLYGGTGYRL